MRNIIIMKIFTDSNKIIVKYELKTGTQIFTLTLKLDV